MKMTLITLAAAVTLLFAGCETATYDAPSFGSGVEPRDATSPTGSITDSNYMR